MYIALKTNTIHNLRTAKTLTPTLGQIDNPISYINQLHNLINILLFGVISVLCGAETWKQMIGFSKSKEDFLKNFIGYLTLLFQKMHQEKEQVMLRKITLNLLKNEKTEKKGIKRKRLKASWA